LKSQDQSVEILSLVSLGATESPIVKSILDSMSDCLIVLDQNGHVLYANKTSGQMLGCSPDDLIDHGLEMLFFMSEKNSDFNQIFLDAVHGKNVNNYSEVDYHHPDGFARRLAATTSYLMAAGEHESSFIGFVVLFKDITEVFNLRREEKELIREKDRITKEKIRSLRKLAMGVAHEIRNPMVTIGGFATRIVKDRKNPEETKRYGRIIVDHVKQLEEVVDRVHECCDLPDINPTKGNLSTVVAETVSEMASLGLKRNISLKFINHTHEQHTVTFDPSLFRLAVKQVLANAIGFSNDGAVVDIAVYPMGEGTVLEVKDYGRGIKDEDKEYIFDPFFSTRAHGTGMGLAIVERIVHEHMGRIEVESELGKGTTVRIMLPHCAAADLECDSP
jgi:PAS domain S-box-containing protein